MEDEKKSVGHDLDGKIVNIKSSLIKIKFRSSELNGTNYTDDHDEEKKNTNTCYLCRRSFASRKSLFGHMRCHPERSWRGVKPPSTTVCSLVNTTSSSITTIASSGVSSSDSGKGVGCKIMDDEIFQAKVEAQAHRLTEWALKGKRGRKSVTSASLEVNNKVNAIADGPEEQQQQHENIQMADEAYDLMMLASCTAYSTEGSQQLDTSTMNSYKMRYYSDGKSVVGDEGGCGHKLHDHHMVNGGSRSNKDNYKKEEEELHVEEHAAGRDRHRQSSSKNGYESRENCNICHEQVTEVIPRNLSEEGIIKKKKRKMTDFTSIKEARLVKVEASSGYTVMDRHDVYNTVNKKQKHHQGYNYCGGDKIYTCLSCKKTFPSHQALGGHRSSHKKGIKCHHHHHLQHEEDRQRHYRYEELRSTEESVTDERGSSNSVTNSNSDVVKKNINDSNTTHLCKICNKTFPTGQALGGHKRCHWSGPTSTPAMVVSVVDRAPPVLPPPSSSSSAVLTSNETGEELNKISSTTSASDGGRGRGRELLNFDLNELPEMEGC